MQPCLVRVIPGVEAATHASQATGHAGSKFGLMPDDARGAIARIERSAKMRLDGVHTHVGSQLLNVEQLAAAVEPIAALGTFEVYDLGGGLGVRYTYDEHPPSLDDYADAMVSQAKALLPKDSRIIVEPGRSMVANSACTLYRVTTLKRGVVTHVAVDGGMGDNLEVSLTGQRFEATIVESRGRRRNRQRRRSALRIGRPTGRRRRRCAIHRSAICSRCPSPAPTATRCPTSTTAPAAFLWCSPATAPRGWWFAATPGTTC